MSQTKIQRKKQQKKKDRQKRHQKERNIMNNLASPKWRLDVLYGGLWKTGIRQFRQWAAVERHKEETEKLRSDGLEIVAGRIVNLQTGETVTEIAPSPAKIEGKGGLPDKLADKPEEAKKGLLGVFKK